MATTFSVLEAIMAPLGSDILHADWILRPDEDLSDQIGLSIRGERNIWGSFMIPNSVWPIGVPCRLSLLVFFVHLFDPHYPYSPPSDCGGVFFPEDVPWSSSPEYPEFEKLRDQGLSAREIDLFTARYDGEILYADRCFGELLDQLEMEALLDQSLTNLVSDHGETLGERYWPIDHGCRLYQEQSRVPLVVRYPHERYAGRRVKQAVHHIDILPTIAGLLGIETGGASEGVSLLQVMEDPDSVKDRKLLSLGRGDPRRVPGLSEPVVDHALIAGIQADRFKLVVDPTAQGEEWELFDLAKDPGEKVNLIGNSPEIAHRLRAELDFFLDDGAESLRRQPPGRLAKADEKALRALGYVQ